MVICDSSIIQRLALASRSCFQGLPESVLLDFLDAEPLHVPLLQAEELDEVGTSALTEVLFSYLNGRIEPEGLATLRVPRPHPARRGGPCKAQLSRSYAARRPLFRFRPTPSESELSSGPPENEISIAFAMLTP